MKTNKSLQQQSPQTTRSNVAIGPVTLEVVNDYQRQRWLLKHNLNVDKHVKHYMTDWTAIVATNIGLCEDCAKGMTAEAIEMVTDPLLLVPMKDVRAERQEIAAAKGLAANDPVFAIKVGDHAKISIVQPEQSYDRCQ